VTREKPCQWNDEMHDASTVGAPAPRPASYGAAVRAYQKLCEQRKAK
jgi:hypothetical protein